MQLKNKIVNYYVMPSPVEKGSPVVFQSPVTIKKSIAKILLGKHLECKGQKLGAGDLLHVCFDIDSRRIYTPNPPSYMSETLETMLLAAKLRITKDFGNYSYAPVISGSPYSSIRIRSIDSFSNAASIIKTHYLDKIKEDIPIIEVALTRMPSTVKNLPAEYRNSENYMGGYVDPKDCQVDFIEEVNLEGIRHSKPIMLLSQYTPFILINMNGGRNNSEPTAAEKDWVVLSGYRDYAYDKNSSLSNDFSSFADLYDIKRSLYLGWSFEEVSGVMMEGVNSIRKMHASINRLMLAAVALKAEGYGDIASEPYLISFKVDPSTSPLGLLKHHRQYPYFKVIDYDIKTATVLIMTPVFIPSNICAGVLKAISHPLICKYNPILNKIDVKSGDKRSNLDELIALKIKAIVKKNLETDKAKNVTFSFTSRASGEWAINPMTYNVRKISEYLYAKDFIDKMCSQNEIKFQDFTVVVGPIEQLLGSGSMGGFMDESMFKASNIEAPMKITDEIYISPPVIFINSVEIPSYAEQTETLIHEYSHFIYGLKNPNYKIGYRRDNKKKGSDYKFWFEYLSDRNEIVAHENEIEYELLLGKSPDEIIRNKVGGQITIQNYPIALKFREMVNEVIEKIEKQEEIHECI